MQNKSPAQRQATRDSMRALRQAIVRDELIASSAKICQRFLQLESFIAATRVAGFLAFDGEADPLALMTQGFEMGKQIYVPMIIEKRKPLLFCPWSPDVPMKINSFGIAEPDVPQDQWIDASDLDFVINPLVAFDEHCHRLGVGGGYYDRSFAFLNQIPAVEIRPTTLVGFAYELQRIEEIVRQPWDVVLDAVVTEWNVYNSDLKKFP